MVQISVPLAVEVTYDWILITIQIWFMILHYLRLRIQYKKASKSKKRKMFKRIDARLLSIGVLSFALLVVFNRFFGITVYEASLKSCDAYLIIAIIFSCLHKGFNYEFILFRLKNQLTTADLNQTTHKLKYIAFYIFAVIIIIFELYFIISLLLFDQISEIDDNRCNFSDQVLQKFVPIYGGADLLFSVILLFFFAFGLWKYRNIEDIIQSKNKHSVKQTLNRILTWSVIAIVSTFISTIIAAIIDGGSPIFLIGDMVVNSVCCVMQFAPLNKNLTLSYKEQWKNFYQILRKEFCGDLNEEHIKNSINSETKSKDSTNFGVKGNIESTHDSSKNISELSEPTQKQENTDNHCTTTI